MLLLNHPGYILKHLMNFLQAAKTKALFFEKGSLLIVCVHPLKNPVQNVVINIASNLLANVSSTVLLLSIKDNLVKFY